MRKRLISGVIVLFCMACGDFLEPKSATEFIPENVSSLNELLLGEAYPIYSLSPNHNVFLGLLDDDVDGADFRVREEGNEKDAAYAVFTWQSDMYSRFEELSVSETTTNLYKNYYRKILGTNAVLDYLSSVTGTQEEINYVEAQALTLRAFYYFHLVNIFGHPYSDNKDGLGVPLKLNSNVETSAPTRATVGEVYTQMLTDLERAEELFKTLPEDQQWSQNNNRVGLPLVQILLSRIHLYMENWEKAAAYANQLILDSKFSLYNLTMETDSITVEDSGTGSDVKVPNYPYMHSSSNSEVLWCYASRYDVINWINIKGDQDPTTQVFHAIFRASEDLLAAYDKPAVGTDLRKNKYILRETQQQANGEYLPLPYGKIGVNMSAYYNTISSTFQNNYARSFRLSEAYLNYAEAKAMLYKNGTDASALAESLSKINDLRSRRVKNHQAISISSADELVKFVRDERRRELCFEDHRWFDLRRYGMPEIQHRWWSNATTQLVYTLKEKDPGYTLPLPLDALEANTALEQNPLAPERVGVLVNN